MYISQRFSPEFVNQLQKTVEDSLLSGVMLDEFISEGTQLQGVPAYTLSELMDAIEYYWDERNNVLITQTTPSFNYYAR
jgi:hypothetical protein